jgi:hypothetical protein
MSTVTHNPDNPDNPDHPAMPLELQQAISQFALISGQSAVADRLK